MQVAIVQGIYTDQAADYRTAYPRNLLAVPKSQGVSSGYLRPGDGIVHQSSAPGPSRGGVEWTGVLYRVLGASLCSVTADGSVTVVGAVNDDGLRCTMDYSFDRLGVVSAGSLWFLKDGLTSRLSDPDAGTVIDALWLSGYWVLTDGDTIAVTELTDQTAVNPLKYGSAEADPDPVKALDTLGGELYVFGRHTIQVQQLTSGTGYPFQDIPGARVARGIVGTHAYAPYLGSFAFVGGGRNEPPGVWILTPGDAIKISTREVDTLLSGLSDAQLSALVIEAKSGQAHQHLMIHLPDQTLVYDAAATKEVGQPVWQTLDSGILIVSRYLARDHVWAYSRWNVADPVGSRIGYLTNTRADHWGADVWHEFITPVVYADGNDAVVHELELVTLPGRGALGEDSTVWTSHSFDGVQWSLERGKAAGGQGDTRRRLVWRRMGRLRHVRMQRFRWLSTAMLSVSRLQMQVEPLTVRPGV